VLHATWNAVTKAVQDRLIVLGWIGVAAVLCGGVGLGFAGMPRPAAIWFVLVSAAIHLAYDFALIRSYRLGAFNQMYPIARGTSPLLVAAGAWLLASEQLSAFALSGIAVLAAGLMTLAASGGRFRRDEAGALAAAALTGVTIASYTLVDGLGVRRSGDPAAYAALLFLLEGPVLVAATSLRRQPTDWVRSRVGLKGLVAGLLSVVAYGAIIWAQARAPLAEVSALRETGVISAAAIGAIFFKERFGAQRVVAAIIVALGIALIGL
jgi:drug/metabolite transporter (DMT)-like permease